jgi:hypothetical protein
MIAVFVDIGGIVDYPFFFLNIMKIDLYYVDVHTSTMPIYMQCYICPTNNSNSINTTYTVYMTLEIMLCLEQVQS